MSRRAQSCVPIQPESLVVGIDERRRVRGAERHATMGRGGRTNMLRPDKTSARLPADLLRVSRPSRE